LGYISFDHLSRIGSKDVVRIWKGSHFVMLVNSESKQNYLSSQLRISWLLVR